MKHLFFLCILLAIFAHPLISLAQGIALFPEEDAINDLQLIVADPDNSATDWMFFNNTTCQFGLMFHDGGRTVAPGYFVNEERDGSFAISFVIGNSQAKRHILTVSSDRTRIYNESGSYYSKVSDNYRDLNDKSFRTRRLAVLGE